MRSQARIRVQVGADLPYTADPAAGSAGPRRLECSRRTSLGDCGVKVVIVG